MIKTNLGDGVGMTSNQSLGSFSLQHIRIRLDRAAHHGVTVGCLLQNGEEVARGLLQVVPLADTSSEVLHSLASAAALKGLVRAMKSENINI